MKTVETKELLCPKCGVVQPIPSDSDGEIRCASCNGSFRFVRDEQVVIGFRVFSMTCMGGNCEPVVETTCINTLRYVGGEFQKLPKKEWTATDTMIFRLCGTVSWFDRPLTDEEKLANGLTLEGVAA